jgi:hypothetical protein
MAVRARLGSRVAVGVLAIWAAAIGPAEADHEPVIAIPGNRQVPVIINGVDASYGVVVGDWGLYRPGQVNPTVIVPPQFYGVQGRWGYFPSTGRRPRYGRQEVRQPARDPGPSSFHRTWSTGPEIHPTMPYPPYDPPPVMLAPGSPN